MTLTNLHNGLHCVEVPEEEKFYPIEGYEDTYEVNILGIIRSIDRKVKYKNGHYYSYKGVELKPCIKNGYFGVTLKKNRITKSVSVHTVVAKTFIPNPENKPQVNHIDGNKLNNHASNLEWNTAKENLEHAVITGLRKMTAGNYKGLAIGRKRKRRAIIQYDTNNNAVKIWESVSEASEILNINKNNICSCLVKKRKLAGNYMWSYM